MIIWQKVSWWWFLSNLYISYWRDKVSQDYTHLSKIFQKLKFWIGCTFDCFFPNLSLIYISFHSNPFIFLYFSYFSPFCKFKSNTIARPFNNYITLKLPIFRPHPPIICNILSQITTPHLSLFLRNVREFQTHNEQTVMIQTS